MGWALNIMAAGAAWACASGLAAAQPPEAVQARLAQVAGSYAPNNAFMGAVLVAEGDKVLLDKGYGQADLAWGLPNAPDVKFRIGSITKQFTAVLVLMLRDEGKLGLTDPVPAISRTRPRRGTRSPSPTCSARHPASRISPPTNAFPNGA